MGKAAAPCSGSGGILSVLSAVPCLSCKLQPHKNRRMSDPLKSTVAALATAVPGYDTYKGWLFKWTNYLKGYQRRWFVLSNGLLSYYRTKAEMAHTCRGTINLATAHIDTEDSCNIVLTSGGRTYHLKASSEVERQRWVTGLELAKAKAIRMMHDQSGGVRPLKVETSDEDEETEYFDAMEDTPAFITVTRDHNPSRISEGNLNEAGRSCHIDWKLDAHVFDGTQAKENNTPGKEVMQKKKRRTRIPDKPNYSLNLWSIMKNCIGKELSKIPMPVNFNEPLSMLQRLTEDLEYHELLDKAAKCESSLEQICYIAAFSVSSYSTTVHRTAKPFNPLLGETYELDRFEEYGYRSLCEQVSHHPPAAAHHVYSRRGWTLWQEITIASKFRGKYLSIMPLGAIHLLFHSSGNHYVWRKVTSTVHNIIVGKLWIDQSGDIDLVNLKTKETCQLKFTPYSYFSRDIPRKVTGVVTDCDNKAQYILSGTWDEKMECAKIMQSSCGNSTSEGKQKTVYQTLPPKLLWKKYPLLENAENMYCFSELALTLNEFEEGVAPTDSRLRPDQRLMENGLWDEANVEKQRLEEKQRSVRRRREAESAEALNGGRVYENYQPLWFEKKVDSATGEMTYMYKGGYWEAKEKQDWKICPDIF
ncbi:oxysterol-binding protein 2-like isoform X5 [Polypterus senegalus]|uniref:oxysterol-binding protein 2-like isoform X5 n=1 Tax=Polypterus senegalus TaxID=55291 RepID=UPI001964B203|nr:oxysterol-binding protein 2-like isoform X5 [Polypterus senegalus]